MPVNYLWAATGTQDSRDAGTNDYVSIMITRDGRRVHDRVLPAFPGFGDRGTCGFHTIGAIPDLEAGKLDDSSYRVGIRGWNMWKATEVLLWGRDRNKIFLLAGSYREHPTLSVEPGEGRTSAPLTRFRAGGDDTQLINFVVVVETNLAGPTPGDDVDVGIFVNSQRTGQIPKSVYASSPKRLTPRAGACQVFSMYAYPTTKAELVSSGSIELITKPGTEWGVQSAYVFGIGYADGPQAVTLVHEPTLGKTVTGNAPLALPIYRP